MDEMNVTEALLKAILELIEKCDTLKSCGTARSRHKKWGG